MSEFNLSKRPAVRFVVFLATGILLGSVCTITASFAFLIVALILVLSLTFLFLRKNPHADLVLAILVLAIGFLLQVSQRERASERKMDPAQEESATIAGWVEGEPVAKEKKTSFVLRADDVRWKGIRERIGRRVLVTLRGGGNRNQTTILRCGSRIVARATLEPFPFQRNPGEFDYGRYLVLNDIQGVATIVAPEDLLVTEQPSLSNFGTFVGYLQRSLYGILDRFHTPEQSSFLKGVILGFRADLSNEIKQSFMNTGTIHILAVSGSNVAVIVLIMYSMFGLLRLPKILVGVFTMLGVFLFTFITGASPSVIRAGIMATVILLGTMVERKPDVYNSLSVAAIIILLIDSNALFDVGFQLSFAAVLSIVYILPILARQIARIPERFEEIKALDYVLKLFAVSLAAQIGTLPFTAYYFGRVSLVSLLANLVVVPLSGLNVLLGVATVFTSFVSPFLASCYAALNKLAVDFLLGFVKVAGNVPYAYAETSRFGMLHATLYYGLCGILLHLATARIVKWGIMVLLSALTVYLGCGILYHRSGILRITVIDVGQGDAILIESPKHKRMLIDAGPRQFKYDAGERTIVPFLRRQGIERLDAILVTHSHNDHIGGVQSIVENLPVGTFIEADFGASSSLYRTTMETVKSRGIPCLEVQRGSCIPLDDGLRLYILHPSLAENVHRSLNNNSVVIKLVYGNTSALLVGDAENEAEGTFCPRYKGFLGSELLKVGHHGSSTSSTAQFLTRVKPAVALMSVGIRNKFGHPSQGTLARLAGFGAAIFRTDREGALVFESDGRSWWKDDWREHSKTEIGSMGDS